MMTGFTRFLQSDEMLDELKSKGIKRQLDEGQNLVYQGQMSRDFPIVQRGSLKVLRPHETARELLLYYVNPGETCAISMFAAWHGIPSPISAFAEEKTDLWLVSGYQVVDWLARFPEWDRFVRNSLSHTLGGLFDVIELLAFQRMDQRLMYYLIQKANVHETLIVQTTHQDIAYELNTSREVISRLLKQFEREKLVELGRNRIKLLNKTNHYVYSRIKG